MTVVWLLFYCFPGPLVWHEPWTWERVIIMEVIILLLLE